MSRYLTNNEKMIIFDLYNKGLNTVQIAKKINKNPSSVQRFLKKNHISLRYNRIPVSNLDVEKIVNLYNKGLSLKEILEELAYLNIKSENTLSKILRQQNIKIRSAQRRIDFDENYFNTINTEEKAYLLGFILSDGNICKIKDRYKSFRIQLCINRNDDYILNRFRKLIHSTNKLKYHRNEVSFSINSNVMAYQLGFYNIFPRKSFHSSLAFHIPKNLFNHYLRGIFDGDGVCSYGRKKFTFGFCGNSFLLINEIQLFLIKEININKTSIYQNNGTYHFDNGAKKDILSFYNYLYKDATIYLDRKKEKFENYFRDKKIPR